MPCPKKKTSRMRRGHRRGHDNATVPTVNNCPNCGAMKLPHNLCQSCGYYKDREVTVGQA